MNLLFSEKEFSSPKAVSTNAAGMESPGVSLALDPEVANEVAAARGSEQTNPQIYKFLYRAERPTSLTLDGSETHGQVVDALRSALDAGHDAVMIKNYPHRVVSGDKISLSLVTLINSAARKRRSIRLEKLILIC